MKVKLKGNKKDGWVIIIEDKDNYDDLQATHEELVALGKEIKKKVK